jgi:hypothetical protein
VSLVFRVETSNVSELTYFKRYGWPVRFEPRAEEEEILRRVDLAARLRRRKRERYAVLH